MKRNDFDVECIEARWIEPAAADGAWTLVTLSQISGLAVSELRELIDYGALQPQNADVVAEERWRFAAHCAVTVRSAVRLRRDFDLDTPGLALALTLVDRIRELQEELRRAHALMPRRG
jgi:chaperone modulatory protein CbpM